jgi:dTMP kinase
MTKGKMISVEGVDAAGKSSQIAGIVRILETHGFEVVQTREPGGTILGEKLRALLLNEKMCPMAEMLTFAAARAEHVETLIKPALAQGKIVICDRFADSTYAYQGAARGFKSDVEELERFVLRGFEPDYTLFFNITLEQSLKRLMARSDNNAFDNADRQFKKDVYDGYRKRFLQNPHRMVLIDAMQSIGNVTKQVSDWLYNSFIPDQVEELYNKDKRKVV